MTTPIPDRDDAAPTEATPSEALLPPPPPDGEIRSGRLAGKTLPAAIFIVAMPVFVEQLAAASVGFVDQAVAGRLPDGVAVPALDAIGIGSYIDWFISLAMATVGVGAAAIIARAIGAGDRELSHETLRQAVLFSVGWGILVAIVLWLGAPLLALGTSLSPEASRHCVDYVRIQAYGLPVMALLQVSIMCLHGAGESVRPFLVMLVVNAVNAVGSVLLSGAEIAAIGDPLGLDLHVRGIAIATVIAKAVGAVLMIVIMRRGVRDLRLEGAVFVPRWSSIKRIARIGIPGFFEGMVMWLGHFAALGVVGLVAVNEGTREGLLGAHIIAIRWESFSFLPGYAMGVAAGALAGQFLGAGNPRQATRAMVWCTLIAAVFMTLAGVVFMVFGEPLTRVISDEPLHLDITPRLLFVIGFFQPFFATAMVIRNGLRGVGDTRWMLMITLFSIYLLRLPGTYVAGITLGGGLVGIWLASGSELVIRSGLCIHRLWHGGWKGVRV